MKTQVSKYTKNSLHYLRNASKSIDAGDIEKASEFLWGSIAQALKALAASKGFRLRSHQQLNAYALGVSKELNDISIYDAFLHANLLHKNFYEAELEQKEVVVRAEIIKTAVGKLLEFISSLEG